MKIVPYLSKYYKWLIAGFILITIGCITNAIIVKPYYTATAYVKPLIKPANNLLKEVNKYGAVKDTRTGLITLTEKASTKQEAREKLVSWVKTYMKWQPNTIKVDRNIKQEKVKPKYLKILFCWFVFGNIIMIGLMSVWEKRIALFWEDKEFE